MDRLGEVTLKDERDTSDNHTALVKLSLANYPIFKLRELS
jgi:hypothetical protein